MIFKKIKSIDTAFDRKFKTSTFFKIRRWISEPLSSLSTMVLIVSLLLITYISLSENFNHANKAYHASLRYDYENRIASLRTQVDRITSQKILDEKKMRQFISHHKQLSKQTERIQNILGKSSSDTHRLSSLPLNFQTNQRRKNSSKDFEDIKSFDATLNHVRSNQMQEVSNLTNNIYEKNETLRETLDSFFPQIQKTKQENIGGPLLSSDPDKTFNLKIRDLDKAIKTLENFQNQVNKLPIANPMPGKKVSSQFGHRIDPFLGEPALHSGIDLSAPSGTPIRATAAGFVKKTGRFDGYGNMVEIDHSNGYSTRFAHMKEIMVSIGDRIQPGQIIGETGSTGRSTGPHLHYEVLQNGKAMDPLPFLKAGKTIFEVFAELGNPSTQGEEKITHLSSF